MAQIKGKGAILAILCALFFSACGDKVAKNSYPSWYLEHSSDLIYLYGVGEGENLNSAKSMALNDLSAQISLQLDSDISIEQSQKTTNNISDFASQTSARVGLQISDIELDSVEYPLIDEIGGHFFIKARIKKSKITQKLNNDIDALIVQIDAILGDIKASKCNTISPKHKKNLSALYNNANTKSRQIRALDGAINSESALKSLQNTLSQTPRAYAINFASGADDGAYQIIDNALTSEFKKFFSIEEKGIGIYAIENFYTIKRDSAVKITLNSAIKDCGGNAIFSIDLEGSGKDIKSATNRLKVQLYKKLHAWQE